MHIAERIITLIHQKGSGFLSFILEYSEYFNRFLFFSCFLFMVSIVFVILFKNIPKKVIYGKLFNKANGDVFDITSIETSIGRSKVCDIIMAYNNVSRLHAVLVKRQDGFEIYDTNSSMGIYVNGKIVKKNEKIFDGDVITLGSTVLVLNAPNMCNQEVKYEQGGNKLD